MLDVPMYFVYRDGRYIDAAGQSFRDFVAGKLPALPGERPTLSDWNDHLTTVFPEVAAAPHNPLSSGIRSVGIKLPLYGPSTRASNAGASIK